MKIYHNEKDEAAASKEGPSLTSLKQNARYQ